MKNTPAETALIRAFLEGKSAHSLGLFDHFIARCKTIGPLSLHPTKSMIGIGPGSKPAAWVTQLGKSFIHIVLPFPQPYPDNLCFQKIAQVPGQQQYNHHLRIQHQEDFNQEVMYYLRLAFEA